MNKLGLLLLVALIAITCAYATVNLAAAPARPDAAMKESAFDRVTRTGTLRCGYAAWYPNLIVDPNTRQFSGVAYDVMSELGKRLGIKVEWSQEAGFGSAEQDLLSGKYDMLCADVCFEARRTKHAYFSRPFQVNPLYLIARADDNRFDAGLTSADAQETVVAVLDNTLMVRAAAAAVPNARQIGISEIGSDADVLAAVLTKKADLSFNNQISVDIYNEKNGGGIKTLRPAVDMCNGSFMMPHGDDRLKLMIDSALEEIIAAGMMPAIYKKYLPDSPDYWRVPATLLRGKEQ